ncbi:unnamed protein product [Chrysodeixis includens]|uniref:Uncharacterized protein n=1 Tax=Chrysodeixis includens TaxID=689277 RepID=A0A9P0G0H9_CHRIL|nr:unnamed protein product [Chrysodeixis includens]
MKSIVLACMLVAVALAAPQGQPAAEPIPIVKDDSQINGDGSYQFAYETGNGISADAKGELKKVGDVDALVVTGEYSYPGDNGEQIQITYTADENGFHPQGALLPTPPPVPEAIQKALDFLATAAPSQPQQ